MHVRAFAGGGASADFAVADQRSATAQYKSLGLNVFFPSWVWAQNPDLTGQHPERAIREETWMGPGDQLLALALGLRPPPYSPWRPRAPPRSPALNATNSLLAS
jgi:hypothetical protein